MTAEATQTRQLMSTNFQALERRLDIDKLLKSLKFPDMNARRNQHAIDADKNTLHWIFEEDERRLWDSFPSWLKSKDKLYWISGKAGSGKSTLTKRLISDPRTAEYLKQWSPSPLIVSYFLWNSGSRMQRSRNGLLSSLILQTLEDQPQIVNALHDQTSIQRKEYLEDWSEAELEGCLLQCLSKSVRPIGLFLDGLDEIGQAEEPTRLLNLVYGLSDLPNVKVCVSSRPEREFVDAFTHTPKMRLQDLTRDDISSVVTTFLEKNFKCGPEDKVNREELVNLVVQKADGVFLWVHLALSSLQRGGIKRDDWDTLTKRLAILPSKLEDFYREMWRRLGDDESLYRREAAFYFNLVLLTDRLGYVRPSIFALSFTGSKWCTEVLEKNRPLPHPSELVEKCNKHQKRIEDCCAGLLEIQAQSEIRVRSKLDITNMKYPMWVRLQILSAKKCAEEVDRLGYLLAKLNHFHEHTRVQFIHRSAADFLLDTQEGREILASDQTSFYERNLFLGESTLFSIIAGAGNHFRDDQSISLAAASRFNTSAVTYKAKVADPLVQTAEKILYRLLEELELLRNRGCDGCKERAWQVPDMILEVIDDFVGFAIRCGHSLTIRNFIESLQARGYAVTDDFRSHVLRAYCEGFFLPQDGLEEDLIVRLLRAGADPDYTLTLRPVGIGIVPQCRALRLSSLEAYLFNIRILLKSEISRRKIDEVVAAIREFIDRGANLSKTILYDYTYTVPSEEATFSVQVLKRELSFCMIWEVNTAQLVRMAVNALQTLA